jgi:uncharacterized membrane protein YeaQ/YmgE (transglycosylase-associated protein family)
MERGCDVAVMSARAGIASPQPWLSTLAVAPPPSPGEQPGSRGGDQGVPFERGEPDGTLGDAVSVETMTSTGAAFAVLGRFVVALPRLGRDPIGSVRPLQRRAARPLASCGVPPDRLAGVSIRTASETSSGSEQATQRDGGSTPMSIIAWIVLGAIAGYLAGFLVRGDEGLGVIGHIVLGIVGALVGGFLAGVLFNTNPINGPLDLSSIVTAVIGAILVVVVVNLVMGRTRTGRGTI